MLPQMQVAKLRECVCELLACSKDGETAETFLKSRYVWGKEIPAGMSLCVKTSHKQRPAFCS